MRILTKLSVKPLIKSNLDVKSLVCTELQMFLHGSEAAEEAMSYIYDSLDVTYDDLTVAYDAVS